MLWPPDRGIDLARRIYTFQNVRAGYTTTIKAKPEGIYIAGLNYMEPLGRLPTYCWPGKRWDLRDWERPNELYFRIRNENESKASWHPQFEVLSEVVEPKRKPD